MISAESYNTTWGRNAALKLYGPKGERKYLNRQERFEVIRAVQHIGRSRRLFVLMLHWTGVRLSGGLSLTADSFQMADGIVSVRTLKRRGLFVREVPVPEALLQAFEDEFHILERQKSPDLAKLPLWPMSSWTAWRLVKRHMREAGITGLRACPKGLRHGFGVGCVQAGIPITLLQRWMGHARLETTAIYTAVCGEEEREIAARFWSMS